ncbi:MAG: hypothetical protein NT062_11260 [Proteobacteria bacterium]|nr:hypothetical protein [Pseudomonadota bacterium]
MRLSSISKFLVAVTLASGGVALAKDPPKPAKPAAKVAPKAKPTKPSPPKKVTVVTDEKKKVLAELFAGFKFGMSKDEVIGVLAKTIDEKYDDQFKKTTDVVQQDRLRKLKKEELAQIKAGYVEFQGKKTGWDVSIVEEEFNHHTNESMVERWEKSGNTNQRRFFFFYEGKLWKMFLSLDVSILPEDKKNFETFKAVMFGKYGPGDLEGDTITWHTDEFDARAIDKLKSYDALGLVIEDSKVKKDLFALREQKAPPKKETTSIIKSVIDPDQKDHPDVNANTNAIDAVIKAQGGKK